MMPKILVLERIHVAGLELMSRFAEVDVCLDLDRTGVLGRVPDADAIVVKSATKVDGALIDRATRLKVVGRAGTGTENIDLAYAAARGITVLTVPTGSTVSAAEFTIAQMLNLCRRLPAARAAVAANDFRRHLLEGRELGALTVGLVGVGNVGIAVAERLSAFGCALIGYDPYTVHGERFAALGGRFVESLCDLLRAADIVSFHVTQTCETTRMLDRKALEHVKPGAIVVNTARGAVIDDQDLIEALDNGRVAAAAVDVLEPEPPFESPPAETSYDHPLLHHERVFVTPHMAASTEDAQRRIAVELAERLKAHL